VDAARWSELYTDERGQLSGASMPADESAIYFNMVSTEADIWMATIE
jgi:hypothetical protein